MILGEQIDKLKETPPRLDKIWMIQTRGSFRFSYWERETNHGRVFFSRVSRPVNSRLGLIGQKLRGSYFSLSIMFLVSNTTIIVSFIHFIKKTTNQVHFKDYLQIRPFKILIPNKVTFKCTIFYFALKLQINAAFFGYRVTKGYSLYILRLLIGSHRICQM